MGQNQFASSRRVFSRPHRHFDRLLSQTLALACPVLFMLCFRKKGPLSAPCLNSANTRSAVLGFQPTLGNMDGYSVPLVPGPTSVPSSILHAYTTNYGSADLEDEFFAQYSRVCDQLAEIVGGRSSGEDFTVVIQSGEGMLSLWGGLKSCLSPGDRVISVASGVFGYGIAEMAMKVGADVRKVEFEYDEVCDDLTRVEAAVKEFHPKMITAVHCETPSGTLNPISGLGRIAREAGALLYVDFVASGGGTPVLVHEWGIDLGLWGSQKVLSMPPALSITTVSPRAWDVIDAVGYVGYDALKPWRHGVRDKYFPYTFNWHALAALDMACKRLLEPGLDVTIEQHTAAASYCRERVSAMGLKLFPKEERYCAPTVTAVCVPDGWTWEQLNAACRAKGMAFGGGWGKLKGKVFRIGHMGTQADIDMLRKGMDVLETILASGPPKQET